MRAVCATVLAWATMVAVTSAFDVTDPVRITLFAAGAAFEGALLAPDPQPRDRVRTLGWAAVVAAAAVVVTVAAHPERGMGGSGTACPADVFVVRAAVLESAGREPGADGCHHRLHHRRRATSRVGRIGWFVLALAVGFGWLALWEAVILPDRPLRSLDLSVQAFSRRAADTVADVVDALNTARDGTISDRRGKSNAAAPRPGKDVSQCHRKAIPRRRRARSGSKRCRSAARCAALGPERAWRTWSPSVEAPDWMRSLPDEIASSISSTLHALAVALRDDADEESRRTAARTAQVLRGRHPRSADADQDWRGARLAARGARGAHAAQVPAKSSPNPSRRQAISPRRCLLRPAHSRQIHSSLLSQT